MERKGHHHTARHRHSADDGGPEIKSTPGLGTRWYAGRPAYWPRRALASLGMLAIVGVILGIVASFLAPILRGAAEGALDHVPGLAALGIVIAVTIAGFVYMWRRTGRLSHARERGKEAEEEAVFFIAVGGFGLAFRILFIVAIVAGGVVARSISAVAAGVVSLAFYGIATCLLGPVLALFVRTLTPARRPVRLP